MAYNTVFAFVYLIELMIAYLFFSKSAESKFKPSLCFIIGLGIFEIGVLVNYFCANVLLNVMFSVTAYITFALVCFKIKLRRVFLYSLLLNILSGTAEVITVFIISSILQIDIKAYTDDISVLIVESCISKLLYFIVSLALLKFVVKEKSEFKYPRGLYVYTVIIIALATAFWYIPTDGEISYRARLLVAVISIILLGTTIMLFLSYQNNIKKENEYLLMKNELNRLNTEKNYYDVLEHQNEQLMIYAHDTKNHLAAIKGLNNNPQIDEYIKKMSKTLSEYSRSCHSGNKTLDVIISRYISECEIKNISFNFDVRLSNLSFAEDFDLVTILGNLLDNAVESAEKSAEKTVTFETDYRNSYEVIIITDSCDAQPVMSNNKLLTTKKDKKLHGLGLKSVSDALKKYDGDVSWEYFTDKKQFVTTVMMRNPQRKQPLL